MRKTPVSPKPRHFPQSPVRRRFSRSPERHIRPKSPPRYARKSPVPQRNDLKMKEMYRSKPRMSPPPKARTPSVSSCSDSQCSGCSSDEDRRIIESKKSSHRLVDRHGPVNRSALPLSPDEHMSKKIKLKERHAKRPTSPTIEKSRRQIASPSPTKRKEKTDKRTRVKIEGEKRRHRSPSSDDSTSSEGNFPALTATTRITLNERFGKMAQWNNDRKYDMSNMKITKKFGRRRSIGSHDSRTKYSRSVANKIFSISTICKRRRPLSRRIIATGKCSGNGTE